MRTITIHNYEEFFIDYIDGNLTSEEREQVALFIEAYPELGAELEDINSLAVVPENVTFDYKSDLKKTIADTPRIDMHNLDELVIARKEGELDDSMSNKLNDFIYSNKNAEREAKLMELTFVNPDLSIVYPGKLKLKKFNIGKFVRQTSYIISAAAAVLLIYFGINSILIPSGSSTQIPQTAAEVTIPSSKTEKSDDLPVSNNESQDLMAIDQPTQPSPKIEKQNNTEIVSKESIQSEQHTDVSEEVRETIILEEIDRNDIGLLANYEFEELPEIELNLYYYLPATEEPGAIQKVVDGFYEISRSSLAYLAQRVNKVGNRNENGIDIREFIDERIPSTLAFNTENFGFYRTSSDK